MFLKVVCVLVLVAASYGLPANTSSDKATDFDLKDKKIYSPVISGEIFNKIDFEEALKVLEEQDTKSENEDLMIQPRGCRVISYKRKSGKVISIKIC